MSIVIKKKRQYVKKKMIQRAIALVFIYFISFISLYAIMHQGNETEEKITKEIVYSNEGEQFLAQNKATEAAEFFLKKVDENPEDYRAITNLAIAYKKLKQLDKAKFYLYKSLELNPNYTLTYIHFADIYITEKNYNVAENAIDIIPTRTKADFLAKADLLIKLAKTESDIEEKIVHYDRALKYYKKYDKNSYNQNIDKIIELMFKSADINKEHQDIKSVLSIYKKIERYKNDCAILNVLALKYKDISADELAIKSISKAINNAYTQDEKRMTKETLISLKYHYEKAKDNANTKILNELLLLLDESTILVDENFTPYSITDDKIEYIKKKKDIIPEISFSVLNKEDTAIPTLYAKVDLYIHSKKITESKKIQIVKSKDVLAAHEKTKSTTVKLDTKINKKKLDKYTIAISLSSDNKNWSLYKLYTNLKVNKK